MVKNKSKHEPNKEMKSVSKNKREKHNNNIKIVYQIDKRAETYRLFSSTQKTATIELLRNSLR